MQVSVYLFYHFLCKFLFFSDKKSLNITHPTLNNQINLHMCKIFSTSRAPTRLCRPTSKVQSQYPATGNLISKIMYISELTTFFFLLKILHI